MRARTLHQMCQRIWQSNTRDANDVRNFILSSSRFTRCISSTMGCILQTRISRCSHPFTGWVSFSVCASKLLAHSVRGGIRGIVILEVLRQIEIELGKRIPVQDFFDLIVGTRLVEITTRTTIIVPLLQLGTDRLFIAPGGSLLWELVSEIGQSTTL